MIVLTIKCQQLNRNAIGIELNSEYVEQTKERLNEKFEGFDSIDERMFRIPNDLNDGCYIRIGNFLSHLEYSLRHGLLG